MKIIDLTGTLEEGVWDYGAPYVPYQLEHTANLETNGYIASRVQITPHTGTHVECVAHWKNDVPGIEQEELEQFIGKAKVLRIPVQGKSLYQITEEELKKAGAEQLCLGDICIIATGWENFWTKENYIADSPFLSVEAAEYLSQKKIKLIALDTPMIGNPNDGIEKVGEGLELPDYVFMKNGINILLGLKNVEQLPDEIMFCAFPLKLKDAEGSPVRAVAMID